MPFSPPPCGRLKPLNFTQDPFVNILKAYPVQDEEACKRYGDVCEEMDKGLGVQVWRIYGMIAANHWMRFPHGKGRLKSLGLTGTYLYFQIKPMRTRYFVIHVDVATVDCMTVRITLSNMVKEPKVACRVLQYPCHPEAERWAMICLNVPSVLAQYTKLIPKGLVIRSVQVCANLYLRAIYSSDILYAQRELPRGMRLSTKVLADECVWLYVPIGIRPEGIALIDAPEDTECDTVEHSACQPCSPNPASTPCPGLSCPLVDSDVAVASAIHSGGAEPARPTEEAELKEVEEQAAAEQAMRNKKFMGMFSAARSRLSAFSTLFSRGALLEVARMIGTPHIALKRGKAAAWAGERRILIPQASTFVHLNIATGLQKCRFGHTAPIESLEVSANFALAATVQNDRTVAPTPQVRVWRLGNDHPTCVSILQCPSVVQVRVFRFDSHCRRIVVAGFDAQKRQQLQIWDVSHLLTEGSCHLIARQVSDFDVACIRFSPFDELSLVSCGKENIRFWRIKNCHMPGCSIVLEAAARANTYTDLDFECSRSFHYPRRGEDERWTAPARVFVSSTSGCVAQVDYVTRQLQAVHKLHGAPIWSLSVTDAFCATASEDHYVRIWPLSFQRCFLHAYSSDAPAVGVEASLDGLDFLCSFADGSAGVLSVSSQKYSPLVRTHAGAIRDAAVSDAWRELYTISTDQTIRVWSLPDLRETFELHCSVDDPTSVACHPLHRVVAVGFHSGAVRLFDFEASLTAARTETAAREAIWPLPRPTVGTCFSGVREGAATAAEEVVAFAGQEAAAGRQKEWKPSSGRWRRRREAGEETGGGSATAAQPQLLLETRHHTHAVTSVQFVRNASRDFRESIAEQNQCLLVSCDALSVICIHDERLEYQLVRRLENPGVHIAPSFHLGPATAAAASSGCPYSAAPGSAATAAGFVPTASPPAICFNADGTRAARYFDSRRICCFSFPALYYICKICLPGRGSSSSYRRSLSSSNGRWASATAARGDARCLRSNSSSYYIGLEGTPASEGEIHITTYRFDSTNPWLLLVCCTDSKLRLYDISAQEESRCTSALSTPESGMEDEDDPFSSPLLFPPTAGMKGRGTSGSGKALETSAAAHGERRSRRRKEAAMLPLPDQALRCMREVSLMSGSIHAAWLSFPAAAGEIPPAAASETATTADPAALGFPLLPQIAITVGADKLLKVWNLDARSTYRGRLRRHNAGSLPRCCSPLMGAPSPSNCERACAGLSDGPAASSTSTGAACPRNCPATGTAGGLPVFSSPSSRNISCCPLAPSGGSCSGAAAGFTDAAAGTNRPHPRTTAASMLPPFYQSFAGHSVAAFMLHMGSDFFLSVSNAEVLLWSLRRHATEALQQPMPAAFPTFLRSLRSRMASAAAATRSRLSPRSCTRTTEKACQNLSCNLQIASPALPGTSIPAKGTCCSATATALPHTRSSANGDCCFAAAKRPSSPSCRPPAFYLSSPLASSCSSSSSAALCDPVTNCAAIHQSTCTDAAAMTQSGGLCACSPSAACTPRAGYCHGASAPGNDKSISQSAAAAVEQTAPALASHTTAVAAQVAAVAQRARAACLTAKRPSHQGQPKQQLTGFPTLQLRHIIGSTVSLCRGGAIWKPQQGLLCHAVGRWIHIERLYVQDARDEQQPHKAVGFLSVCGAPPLSTCGASMSPRNQERYHSHSSPQSLECHHARRLRRQSCRNLPSQAIVGASGGGLRPRGSCSNCTGNSGCRRSLSAAAGARRKAGAGRRRVAASSRNVILDRSDCGDLAPTVSTGLGNDSDTVLDAAASTCSCCCGCCSCCNLKSTAAPVACGITGATTTGAADEEGEEATAALQHDWCTCELQAPSSGSSSSDRFGLCRDRSLGAVLTMAIDMKAKLLASIHLRSAESVSWHGCEGCSGLDSFKDDVLLALWHVDSCTLANIALLPRRWYSDIQAAPAVEGPNSSSLSLAPWLPASPALAFCGPGLLVSASPTCRPHLDVFRVDDFTRVRCCGCPPASFSSALSTTVPRCCFSGGGLGSRAVKQRQQQQRNRCATAVLSASCSSACCEHSRHCSKCNIQPVVGSPVESPIVRLLTSFRPEDTEVVYISPRSATFWKIEELRMVPAVPTAATIATATAREDVGDDSMHLEKSVDCYSKDRKQPQMTLQFQYVRLPPRMRTDDTMRYTTGCLTKTASRPFSLLLLLATNKGLLYGVDFDENVLLFELQVTSSESVTSLACERSQQLFCGIGNSLKRYTVDLNVLPGIYMHTAEECSGEEQLGEVRCCQQEVRLPSIDVRHISADAFSFNLDGAIKTLQHEPDAAEAIVSTTGNSLWYVIRPRQFVYVVSTRTHLQLSYENSYPLRKPVLWRLQKDFFSPCSSISLVPVEPVPTAGVSRDTVKNVMRLSLGVMLLLRRLSQAPRSVVLLVSWRKTFSWKEMWFSDFHCCFLRVIPASAAAGGAAVQLFLGLFPSRRQPFRRLAAATETSRLSASVDALRSGGSLFSCGSAADPFSPAVTCPTTVRGGGAAATGCSVGSSPTVFATAGRDATVRIFTCWPRPQQCVVLSLKHRCRGITFLQRHLLLVVLESGWMRLVDLRTFKVTGKLKITSAADPPTQVACVAGGARRISLFRGDVTSRSRENHALVATRAGAVLSIQFVTEESCFSRANDRSGAPATPTGTVVKHASVSNITSLLFKNRIAELQPGYCVTLGAEAPAAGLGGSIKNGGGANVAPTHRFQQGHKTGSPTFPAVTSIAVKRVISRVVDESRTLQAVKVAVCARNGVCAVGMYMPNEETLHMEWLADAAFMLDVPPHPTRGDCHQADLNALQTLAAFVGDNSLVLARGTSLWTVDCTKRELTRAVDLATSHPGCLNEAAYLIDSLAYCSEANVLILCVTGGDLLVVQVPTFSIRSAFAPSFHPSLLASAEHRPGYACVVLIDTTDVLVARGNILLSARVA